MIRSILVICLLNCIVVSAFATNRCHYPISKSEIIDLTNQLLNKHFSNLSLHRDNKLLEVKFFKADEYYFKTMFKKADFLKFRKNRKLFLYINVNVLECPPSTEGLKSILAHEMFHLQDYLTSSSYDLLKLGLKYRSRKTRARYERYTDLRAMKLNFARGLIEYREWIYPSLNKKQLKKKRALYFTPKEIKNWIINN